MQSRVPAGSLGVAIMPTTKESKVPQQRVQAKVPKLTEHPHQERAGLRKIEKILRNSQLKPKVYFSFHS
jgi:hypothetical protein